MVIGLSGVQFSLKSYKWLTKSDDPVAGVQFLWSQAWLQTELDHMKFCYQITKTITKSVIFQA